METGGEGAPPMVVQTPQPSCEGPQGAVPVLICTCIEL